MKRSKHRLSHQRIASFDMGQLVPVACVEALPGDTFRHSSSVLLRIASMANPVMHQISARMHHWFVPSRLIMNSVLGNFNAWERFITKTDDASPITIKSLEIGASDSDAGTLANHLGLPHDLATGTDVNYLPFAAYQMIWNEHYRDQDLETEVDFSSATVLKTMRRVCWEKDYFTSCRTSPQSGSAITVPLAGTANVAGLGRGANATPTASATYRDSTATDITGPAYHGVDSGEIFMRAASTSQNANPVVNVDLSQGSADVRAIKQAFALQRFAEARSRYGSRYRDYLRYLGIRPSDGRLEEPEYLGGGKQTVAVSEVLATAEGTNTDVGDMSGHGIAALRTRPYTRFFEEHGYVLSLLSVRPRAIYQQQVPRMFLRASADDFWHKEFEAFGPQAVSKFEVYGAHTSESEVFGYNDRYSEYRQQPSLVSGLFQTTRDDWHMAREFGAVPSLNDTFVSCTPTDRIYNDANEPECYAMVNHKLIARRLVSKNARLL